MRPITQHIIHCSDSEFGDVSIIRHWHLERGFNDVGYHFVIRRDGEIEVGRPLNIVGAHCYGQNLSSIGTCLIGKAEFTNMQFVALRRLHHDLQQQFADLTIHGHREFNPAKTCPNFAVSDLFAE